MEIVVSTRSDHRGEQVPSGIKLDSRMIEVTELLDQWRGDKESYFKVKDGSGNLYILHFDEKRSHWDLTMYQTERGETVSARHTLEPARRTPRRKDGPL
jgi:hypothetical protein